MTAENLTPPETPFAKIRRNLIGSIGVALGVFMATSLINLALIGWMGHVDGLSLIGWWTLVMTIMSFVYIIDFGLRDALTRSVTLSESVQPLSIILRLCKWTFSISAILSIFGLIVVQLAGLRFDMCILGLLAGWAGILQVTSGWLISVRLGKHEHYWFYLKTLIRVIIQTISVIVLLQSTDKFLALGIGVFTGALAETALSIFAVSGQFSTWLKRDDRSEPTFREIVDLAKGFGFANVPQRLQEPILRILLTKFGGPELLGAFTVASKLPQTASAAISNGMRPMLPGLSTMSTDPAATNSIRLISQSLFLQMALGLPFSIFLWFNSANIFEIWLNQTDQNLVAVTKILIFGYMAINLTVPFFWATQAFGKAHIVGSFTVVNIAIIAAFCSITYYFDGVNLRRFALIVAISQVVFSLSIHWYCAARWKIVLESYWKVNWRYLLTLTIPLYLSNFILSLWNSKAAIHLPIAISVSTATLLVSFAQIAAVRSKRKNPSIQNQ
ncbi:lipopolysaccharide biosynthesis protein [Aliiruegeria sabulilitoris]|uniref:lipopolysaccharide biosynthesis protein n=1 Tax=Aliiruegeria sabulilitoris TaxID=1510458 RepID=UPI0008327B2D|nr:hypothetical protein [Aliiruegeria sabulilitoris]NDR56619.1 hypothetical protein [Pseudoruegeria sp. M32A2M]